jgi:hypothetical protein
MRAYNVSSEESVTIRELAETVVATLKPGTEIHAGVSLFPVRCAG